jgi:hypothetical protein
VFNNVGTNLTNANAAALAAIFTNHSIALALDVSGQDLQGLALILVDVHNLTVGANGTLTGTIP